MYGSTDIHRLRTTISPGAGSGASISASLKSPGFGSPTGLAARWISRERLTRAARSPVDPGERLRHARWLFGALHLDRALALDLNAARNVGHLHDLRAAAPLRADRQWRGEPHPVEAVVDGHLRVGDVHQLTHHVRHQRQR